jgi:hypothetical protein
LLQSTKEEGEQCCQTTHGTVQPWIESTNGTIGQYMSTSVHEHVESTRQYMSTVPNATGGEQIRTVPETSFTGTTNATLVSAKELH